MRQVKLIDISCTILTETERAWLIDAGTGEKIWVLKSLVEYDDTDNTMTMPQFLAEEKGLV